MTTISVNGLSIVAVFDSTSERSYLPIEEFQRLRSISLPPFLITTPTAYGPFSTALTFFHHGDSIAVLGRDWFSFVGDYYISQGQLPPEITSYNLTATCESLEPWLSTSSNSFLSASPTNNLPITAYTRPDIETSVNVDSAAAGSCSNHVLPAVTHALDTLCNPHSPLYGLSDSSSSKTTRSLADHGIIMTGHSHKLQQQTLVHHIMNGLCAGSSSDACHWIAGSAKPRQLAFDISSRVQKAALAATVPFPTLRVIAQGLGYAVGKSQNEYQQLVTILNERLERIPQHTTVSLACVFDRLATTLKHVFLELAADHGISCAGTREEISDIVVNHFRAAACLEKERDFSSCGDVARESPNGGNNDNDLQGYLFASVAPHIRLKPLRSLLRQHEIEHNPNANLGTLRRILKAHARMLLKGK